MHIYMCIYIYTHTIWVHGRLGHQDSNVHGQDRDTRVIFIPQGSAFPARRVLGTSFHSQHGAGNRKQKTHYLSTSTLWNSNCHPSIIGCSRHSSRQSWHASDSSAMGDVGHQQCSDSVLRTCPLMLYGVLILAIHRIASAESPSLSLSHNRPIWTSKPYFYCAIVCLAPLPEV